MQTYDILMVLVLAGATLFGLWKGMAWQVASLASLVLSYFAALKFSDQLAPMISNHAPWNKFVAMLAIYVGTSFVIWMAFRLVSGIIDKVKMESFDRQMGAFIGFAKGVLLCIAITFFAVGILPQQKEMIINSQSGRYIVQLLDKTDAVVPPEIHQVLQPYLRRVEEQLDPNGQPSSGFDFSSNITGDSTIIFPSETEQPSVYQPQPSPQPSQPTWQPPQPTNDQQPVWPQQPQTADRPQNAPI